MKFINKKLRIAAMGLAVLLAIAGCQKMERPPLKNLILDPTPPPYMDLKSFWAFENNLNDQGEDTLTPTGVKVTYVTGVNGQAAQIGDGGYILLPAIGDTTNYENGYQGFPADTLSSLGSYTLSFWMNGTGPVQGGAQGLFSISNSKEFWGNLDLFLENFKDDADPSIAYLKIHMFNYSGSGNGEQWNETKIPKVLNKWTHIAITYNATTSALNVYADGQVTDIKNKILADGKYGPLKFQNFAGMVLGTYQFQTTPSLTNHGPESWAKSFNGALDQFRLYNRALSDAEINDLYTSKK